MDENKKKEKVVEFKDSKQREQERKEYKEKLRRHKRRNRLIGLGVALGLAACTTAFWVYDQTRTFQQYNIVWEKNIQQEQGSACVSWGTYVLLYSNNGASCMKEDGTVLWYLSYDMLLPKVVIQDEYCLIMDCKGTEFYICNKYTGVTGRGQTPYTISQGNISSQGISALVCNNDDISYIYYYKVTGERLDIEIKATMERVGYPLSMAMSPDGKSLMVSYVYVEGGGMQNKIVFYDFSGETKETVAGTFSQYGDTDTLVPKVLFANNGSAVAIGDNRMIFYSIDLNGKGRIPSVVNDVLLEHQVISMFAENGCIGLVWEQRGEEDDTEMLTLYDTDGNMILDQAIDFNYRNMFYNGKYLVLYNSVECKIYAQNGKVKYENTFLNDISQILPGPSTKEFYFVIGDKLQRIRLL